MVCCSACVANGLNGEGHSKSSVNCPLKKDEHENLYQNFRTYVKENHVTSLDTKEEIQVVASHFDISPNKVSGLWKELYNRDKPYFLNMEIPDDDFNDLFQASLKECEECGSIKCYAKENLMKVWKGRQLCSPCWSQYEPLRQELWAGVETFLRESGIDECTICREPYACRYGFHFDHLNMFDKNESISSMINKGYDISEIIEEIKLCQLVCSGCHSFITKCEGLMVFKRIKMELTRNLNENKITEEEYNKEMAGYSEIYAVKMKSVYERFRLLFDKQNKK